MVLDGCNDLEIPAKYSRAIVRNAGRRESDGGRARIGTGLDVTLFVWGRPPQQIDGVNRVSVYMLNLSRLILVLGAPLLIMNPVAFLALFKGVQLCRAATGSALSDDLRYHSYCDAAWSVLSGLCVVFFTLCILFIVRHSPPFTHPTFFYMNAAFELSIVGQMYTLLIVAVYGHACSMAAQLAALDSQHRVPPIVSDHSFSPVRPRPPTTQPDTLIPMGIPVTDHVTTIENSTLSVDGSRRVEPIRYSV
jgi:hypothetical protein